MAIRCIEAEIKEMRQVLVVNNLKMHAHRVGESSSKVRAVGREATLGGVSKGKRALSHYDKAECHGNSQTVALGRRSDPLSRVHFGVEIRHALNAK